jgi:hypothetical protein
VSRHGVRVAVGEREAGFRKISRTTWRAGAVGLVLSGLIAGVFHSTADVTSDSGRSGSGAATGHAGRGAAGTGGGQSGGSSIVIPAQPPAPASGSGQVTSGAS